MIRLQLPIRSGGRLVPGTLLALLISASAPCLAQGAAPAGGYLFHDDHFHLTNYVQEGTDIRDFLTIMGDKVGRVALFGIPLQQTWSYRNSGDFAPTYYLQTDSPLYYYSFTDAFIAMSYRKLTPEQQARVDPMITGFNPADMYAADHIRRVLETFPGVFTGIGEFTIHKEFVSSKIAGDVASSNDPALDRILDFAGEVGLVSIVHNDIDVPYPKPDQEPYELKQMADLFRRHPKTTIIWAHIGVGRVVRPLEQPGGAHRARARRPDARARLLRHLLDRGGQVHRLEPGVDRARGAPDQSPSGPVPVRHRRSGAQGPDFLSEDLRHLRSAPRAAHARGEGEAAQGQLRTALRPGAAPRARVGEEQRQEVEEDEMNGAAKGTRLWTALGAALLLASVGGAWADTGAAVADPQGEAAAEAAKAAKPRLDIYGFVMLDMGYQDGQSHPDWFDVARPTKLPSFENEFGADGHFFAGVRQSRLGFKGYLPSAWGEVKTIFEFELFGTGADAGQTTFRLRHAWVEVAGLGAGQTWSPFMDPDVFPNSIEYWGPNGMVFFRNVQLRWTPWQNEDGSSRFVVALERPGASGDQGVYEDRIELSGIQGHFPLPDLSGHFRMGGDWGHFQAAGIVRKIEWEDNLNDGLDLSGSEVGWGVNLSSNIKLGSNVLRLSGTFGEGIQNYMNDAPVDIGIENNFGNPNRPVEGVTIPMVSAVAFLDLNWSDRMSSTVGYSFLDIDNTSGQADNAFKKGQYALANILFYPLPNLMLGPEIQWIDRENFRDGFSANDMRIQFSVKYNFGTYSIGGK